MQRRWGQPQLDAGGPDPGSDQVTSQTTIPVGATGSPGCGTSHDRPTSTTWTPRPTHPARSSAGSPQVLELYARRSPQGRAELAAAGEKHPALVSVTRKSFNKKHDLSASTIEAVEDALVADRWRSAGCSPARGWAATCRRHRRSSATDRRGAGLPCSRRGRRRQLCRHLVLGCCFSQRPDPATR